MARMSFIHTNHSKKPITHSTSEAQIRFPSSTTTTTGAAATTVIMDRQTYWCHECDMSISLFPSSATASSSLLCPHCNSDFLEELDSPLLFNDNNNPTDNPNPNHDPLLFTSFLDPSTPATTDSTTTFHLPAVAPSDDNFLLDSPYLHRLIHHLTNNNPDADDNNNNNSNSAPSTSRYHSPAAKSAVESIPSVKITTAFLDVDPIILCAVCKDQFVIDDETKQLPCKHMYHPDCILPWLSQHNSCPVCRFQLPTEAAGGDLKVRRRSRSRVLRLGDLMEDDNDEEMLGFSLRHLARRHRLVFPMRHYNRPPEVEPEVMLTENQIGEEIEVDVLPDSGRANSVETLSSWPNWPVGGGAVEGGDISVTAAMVNDDADIVIS